MNILIPMAGAGQRFVDKGYTTPKPLIPVTYHRSFKNGEDCSIFQIKSDESFETEDERVYRLVHDRDRELINCEGSSKNGEDCSIFQIKSDESFKSEIEGVCKQDRVLKKDEGSFKNGEWKIPMVVAATLDLQVQDQAARTIFITRNISEGTKNEISSHIKNSVFVNTKKITEGQACSCLLARDLIDNEDELFISGCDNGILYDIQKFAELKEKYDCLVFTFRNNAAVEETPSAYGWVRVNNANEVLEVSVKKPISDNPIKDHAVISIFWFKQGKDFVEAADAMIANNDRINGEFYVDQTINYLINIGKKAAVLEVDKYFCWGTPKDYENYEQTIKYWQEFMDLEGL